MDEAFPPRFPVLVSSSSLDALIHASVPEEVSNQTQNRAVSLSSSDHLHPPLSSVSARLQFNMISKSKTARRSTVDEKTLPPLPSKDRTPPGSPSSSSSSLSSSSGRARRKFPIRRPKPQRPFARLLDLNLSGSASESSGSTGSGGVISPSVCTSPSPIATPLLDTPELIPDSPSPSHPDLINWGEESDEESETRCWRDFSTVVYRRGTIPHHAYPREKVPYMQAYSATALDTERHALGLLLKLMPTDSPTFYDYGSKPPTTVLDLGCGRGYWAVHAAKKWKFANTKITAFDILDLGGPLREELDPGVAENVSWVRGNFVMCKLPFPDDSFELVRMSNLTLTIPFIAWDFLLQDICRILKPGYRLELIDDAIRFPKILHPFDGPHDPVKASWRKAGLWDKSEQRDSTSRPPLLQGQNLNKSASDPRREWECLKESAIWLERHFEDMLWLKYGIHPRPAAFISSKLGAAFGHRHHQDLCRFVIAVPTTPEEQEPPVGITPGRSVESDKPAQERPGLPRSNSTQAIATLNQRPEGIGKVLLANMRKNSFDQGKPHKEVVNLTRGDSGRATSSSSVRDENLSHPINKDPLSRDPKKVAKYQPEGIIIKPSTFVPAKPDVLDFYVNHNPHVLMTCKYALGTYLLELAAKQSPPLDFTEADFDDMMWDYERFRRVRLNWPRDIPGLKFEDDEPSPFSPLNFLSFASKGVDSSRSSLGRRRSRSMDNILYRKMESRPEDVDVRTIRVFEARKPKKSSKEPQSRGSVHPKCASR